MEVAYSTRSSSSSSSSPSSSSSSSDHSEEKASKFLCGRCRAVPWDEEAFATPCGHLFCEQCLFEWMHAGSRTGYSGAGHGYNTIKKPMMSCPLCGSAMGAGPCDRAPVRITTPAQDERRHYNQRMLRRGDCRVLASSTHVVVLGRYLDEHITLSPFDGMAFSCRRCFKDQASQPVLLSRCGHLYCWSCLRHISCELRWSRCLVCDVPFSGDHAIIPITLLDDPDQHIELEQTRSASIARQPQNNNNNVPPAIISRPGDRINAAGACGGNMGRHLHQLRLGILDS